MTFKETILSEVLHIFQQYGIEALSETEIRNRTDISQATYNELFADKEDLVLQTVKNDMEVQRVRREALLEPAESAIDELLLLLKDGISNMKKTNPAFVMDLQQFYPRVWQVCLEHLNTNSYHEIYDILNRGVQSKHFRKDVNMELVTKIILEMVNMLLNPNVFPPERYDLSEVYRSIYLYYFRGICTDTGAKNVDVFFANNQF